jgi:hypothetical protein
VQSGPAKSLENSGRSAADDALQICRETNSRLSGSKKMGFENEFVMFGRGAENRGG